MPVAVFCVMAPVAVFCVMPPVAVFCVMAPVAVLNVLVPVFCEPPAMLPPPTVLNDWRHPVGTPVKVSAPVCEGKAVPLSDGSGIVIV